METHQELTELERLWDQAIVKNDIDEIAKFMSPEWVIIGTDGGITSKSSFLESVKSGDLIHTKMDFKDIRVKTYDNTGVVTSRGTSSGSYKGHPFSFYEWSTSVYIKSDEKWSCVLTMLTPAKVVK